ALVDEKNQYLVERYAISYLTSGRDLLRFEQTPQQNQTPPLVVANPVFGRIATVARQADHNSRNPQARNQGRVQIDRSQIFFQPVPGREDEALAIKAVLPETTVLLGEQATEATLKKVRAPRILHIATHGFFLSDQETPSTEARSVRGKKPRAISNLRLSKWAVHVENPLL